ncbi:phasin-related domain-containing protein [Candidatus Formimonas warabiya]|uniref:Polyhydroxyalkanoate synthesis regulator n=1 Tax=Formimonas warabiya TaxID=1761012 RepID=A0A3G1KVK3_FORW1|nr:hypothetical protein [Candidatus Formimonas warabiya]ATW26437.1 hypothetical protein DCMF_18280 [Candidatus Formimonas warabiya]
MTNLLEKSIYLGLGMFMHSREKVEELVEELVNKGEIAKKDAQHFAVDLIKKGEEQREEFKKLIADEIRAALDQMNIASKGDIVSKKEIGEIVRDQIIQVLQEQGLTKKENEK